MLCGVLSNCTKDNVGGMMDSWPVLNGFAVGIQLPDSLGICADQNGNLLGIEFNLRTCTAVKGCGIVSDTASSLLLLWTLN